MTDRRSQSPSTAAARAAIACLASFCAAAFGARADERPNFVLVVVDDASEGQIQKYLPLTKRRFGELGVNVLNLRSAYCTTPLCSPSRASLLTGQYAHTTGVHFNEGPAGGAGAFAASGADRDTIATRLRRAGYDTAMVGKYMNSYDELPGPYVPPGWDYWRVIHGLGSGGFFNYTIATELGALTRYGSSDADYSTDVFKQRAIRFLQSAGDRPFFLALSPTAPHEPAIPATRHRSMYPFLAGAPRPPNYANPADKIGKPDWVQGLSWTAQNAADDDAFFVNQARTLAAVDEMMVEIVNGLEARGELGNTIFFFATDNGYSHGEHFWRGKATAYEPSVKTSLVIASRSRVPAGGAERPQLAGLIDVAATVYDLAGETGGPPIAGVSLAPVLDSDDVWPREDLLVERRSKNPSGDGTPANPVPSWNGLVARRDGRMWKYLELAAGVVNRELYDLTGDPYELVNVASDPERAGLVAELSLRIRELGGE